MVKTQSFSFKKGWNQLRQSDVAEARDKIVAALNLKVKTSFYNRLNGKYEPTVSEAQKIEAVFAEYGITDIWGEE